jgi:hypothetical protein
LNPPFTVHPWTENARKPHKIGISDFQVPWLSTAENTKVIQKVIQKEKPHAVMAWGLSPNREEG